MSAPDHAAFAVGAELPSTSHRPDEVQLFLYNAALWNAHRIHFDLPYAREAEGYPGLVVAGPLMGDWLAQAVDDWMGDAGVLVRFEYSNRRAAYLGDTLTAGGRIRALDGQRREAELELAVTNQAGEVVTPGAAVVRFDTGAWPPDTGTGRNTGRNTGRKDR